MMLKLVTVAAAVALAQAKPKTYIFNAENCNTNFDRAENWGFKGQATTLTNLVVEGKTSYPAAVEFADASGQGVPVEAYLPANEYRQKKIKLGMNGKLTFATEGSILSFVKVGKGTATFTAGQTSGNNKCSLGCHDNFFETSLSSDSEGLVKALSSKNDIQDAVANGVTEGATLQAAAYTPCNDDTVVLPRGYGFNFLALGFHAYNSVVYANGDESYVVAKDVDQLPRYMTWTSMQQKVFVGPDVKNQCQAYGHYDTTNKACVCTTECPNNMVDAVTQASELRKWTKAHAQRRLKEMKKQSLINKKHSFVFEFANAYNGPSQASCTLQAVLSNSIKTFPNVEKNIAEYFAQAVSTSVTDVEFLPNNRFTVTGQIFKTPSEWTDSWTLRYPGAIAAQDKYDAGVYDTCGSNGTATVAELKNGTAADNCKALFDGELKQNPETCGCLLGMELDQNNHFTAIKGDCSPFGGASVDTILAACVAENAAAPTAVVDVRTDDDAAFAMQVYHAVIAEMKNATCIADADTLVASAGIQWSDTSSLQVYGGGNLPQMDVFRFVDENNKDGVVDHVYNGLVAMNPGITLAEDAKDKMKEAWGISSPGDRVHGKNAITTPEAHVDARYGLATQLVVVNIKYSGWSTSSGPNMHLIEQMVNNLLATYELQSHHQCFSFELGYDDECIATIVAQHIKKELGKKACGFGQFFTCKDAAVELAVEAIISIKKCGILGTYKAADGVDENGKAKYTMKCADTDEEARVMGLAMKLANETASEQVASLMTAHSSSMYAYSSSKEAVRVTLQVAYDDYVLKRGGEEMERVKDLTAKIASIKQEVKDITVKIQGTEKTPNAKGGEGGIDEVWYKRLTGEVCEDGVGGFSDKEKMEQRFELRECSQVGKNSLAQKRDQSKAEWIVAEKAFVECNATEFNYTSNWESPEYCADEFKEWAAADTKYQQDNTRLTLSAEAYMAFLGEHYKSGAFQKERDYFAAIQGMVKTGIVNHKEVAAKLDATIARKEAEESANGCGGALKGSAACESLEKQIKALKAKRESDVALDEQYTDSDARSETMASKFSDPEEDDNMMMIIIIAGAAVVVLLICLAVVMLSGGSKDKNDDSHNVVAFENPMYDDPNLQYQGGGYGEDPNQYGANPYGANPADGEVSREADAAPYGAPPAQDAGDGLYDEPEMVTGGDGGGGYLDVAPDDDDDDDDEESEQESEKESDEEEDEEDEKEAEKESDQEDEEEDEDEDEDEESDDDDDESDDE